MQLQFSAEEFKVLAEVLREDELALQRLPATNSLLNRILDRDLRFDFSELEDLSDILADSSRRLHDLLMRNEDPAIRRKQEVVQRMLDRVIEAEAMV